MAINYRSLIGPFLTRCRGKAVGASHSIRFRKCTFSGREGELSGELLGSANSDGERHDPVHQQTVGQ